YGYVVLFTIRTKIPGVASGDYSIGKFDTVDSELVPDFITSRLSAPPFIANHSLHTLLEYSNGRAGAPTRATLTVRRTTPDVDFRTENIWDVHYAFDATAGRNFEVGREVTGEVCEITAGPPEAVDGSEAHDELIERLRRRNESTRPATEDFQKPWPAEVVLSEAQQLDTLITTLLRRM